jgi:hypothetical protein
MAFADKSHHLRINFDAKNCDFSEAELAKIETALDPLRDLVRNFPVSDLYITVHFHPRSNDYHVKTSLVLTGRTLFTGDRDAHMYPAFNRCVRKLVHKAQAYEEDLGGKPEISKEREGTRHELVPDAEPDLKAATAAVEGGNYAAFRRATYAYEEPLHKRTGRWIERYPEIAAQLGNQFTLEDIVEEVFLTAFDQYGRRPEPQRFGQWLEDLIDPALKALAEHPAEEQENINLARTWHEAEKNEPGA